MAGYTRQDTANNIANGQVIDADDFDAEYNAIEAGFNASTGHKHDGSSGEGAAITKVGPSQDLIISGSQVLPKTANTLDLGSNTTRFKDAYIDGTTVTDAATITNNVTVGGTLGVTGLVTASGGVSGNVTGNLTGNVTGNLTGNITGQVSDVSNHDTDDVTEGSSNLYHTTARVRNAISATGSINYNSTTGVVSFTQGNTDTIAEGSSNLYHTTARARASISASGSINYNSTTGVVSFTQGNTDTVAEGSSNLYHTTARARAAISATDAGGDGSLSYNSTTGAITYTGPSAAEVRAHFSAGAGIGISNGSISHSDTSSQTSVNGSGRTYIQDITLDTYGHVTGLSTATETVVNTNTTYSAGGGLSLSGTTFSHTDTSSQGSVNNSNGTVIQDITLDGYGHITGLSSVNLDGRYFTEGESNSRFAYKAGSGSQNFSANNLYATAFYYSSDERLKENILPVTNSLDVIGQLQGVSFDWSETGNHDIGVIAQEVAAIIPEAVVAKDDGFLSVNATPIIAHLIEAVKELKAEVDRLNDKP